MSIETEPTPSQSDAAAAFSTVKAFITRENPELLPPLLEIGKISKLDESAIETVFYRNPTHFTQEERDLLPTLGASTSYQLQGETLADMGERIVIDKPIESKRGIFHFDQQAITGEVAFMTDIELYRMTRLKTLAEQLDILRAQNERVMAISPNLRVIMLPNAATLFALELLEQPTPESGLFKLSRFGDGQMAAGCQVHKNMLVSFLVADGYEADRPFGSVGALFLIVNNVVAESVGPLRSYMEPITLSGLGAPVKPAAA